MTIARFVFGMLGTAIVATGLIVASPVPASAACIGGTVTGNVASGSLRLLVERRARLNWTARTRAIYGSRFSNWYVARNRLMTCNRSRPTNNWNCVARGRACDRAS